MAVTRGIAFVRSMQRSDGSFASYSSPTLTPFNPEKEYRTTFTPALILGALAGIDSAADIRGPLAEWLIAQRGPAWSFSYWAKDALERRTHPYPDDLDDTFCALASLHRHDPATITAARLGTIIKLLLATEQAVGGPYRTWLVPANAPDNWQDVDLAVNCNVAYFLQLVAKPLPSLTALIDKAINSQTFTSPYYPASMPVLYFAARAYSGGNTRQLAAQIIAQPTDTALDAALKCSALTHLDESAAAAPLVQQLCASQQANGSWPAEAFCLDPAQGKTTYYHGAEALTTALAVEALAQYRIQSRKTRPLRSRNASQPGSELIVQEAKKSFTHLGRELRRQVYAMIDQIAASDTSQEIVLMPQLFANSFRSAKPLPTDMLATLSRANLFGWLAYTIYDDFLDEQGSTPLLPVANTALRASLKEFEATLDGYADGWQLVHDTFDLIDSANSWEVAVCRGTVQGDTLTVLQLPRYGKLEKLAERSLGHTLTPVIILLLQGYKLDSPEIQGMQTSLRHYLIARQLLDDMHDWEEDLRRGHLNPIVVELMRATRLEPGDHALSELIPRLRRAFWQWTLSTMCTRTERHIAAARRAALHTKLFIPDSSFVGLLDRLDAMLKDTRAKQAAATDFLQAYKKPLV
ncbi:MAG: hypothetical protein ABWY71_01820 [Candidatus Saccharimonadales bacterium]